MVGMSLREGERAVGELTGEERAYAEAEIDAALAPYRGRLSDGELAWMRATLAAQLAADPAAALLVREAYPREVDESGEILRGPSAAGVPLAGVPVAVAPGGRRR